MMTNEIELIPIIFTWRITKATAALFIALIVMQILQLLFNKVYNKFYRIVIDIIAIAFATISIINEMLKLFDNVTFPNEIWQRLFYILISLAIAGYTLYFQNKE